MKERIMPYMYSIILAGGRGERLGYHTENRPKPLLEIAGRSMLEHQILQAQCAGINDFILLESYKAEAIQKKFGDGASLGVSITHLQLPFELGSAGAIRQAVEVLPNSEEDVLVMYGDILSNVDLSKMIEQSRKNRGLVTDLAVKWQIPYGVLQEGSIEKPVIEKPTIRINGAIYVLRRELWTPFNSLPERGDFSKNVVEGLSGIYLDHYKHEGFWVGVDTPIDVVKAEQNLDKWVIGEKFTFSKERQG